jgi:hypothetical protein
MHGYYTHSCTNASGLPPPFSVGQCQDMAIALPRFVVNQIHILVVFSASANLKLTG